MKNLLWTAIFLLFSHSVHAQSFEILNPRIYQGDVVIVRIYPQFQTQAQGSPVCIFVEWQINNEPAFPVKHYSPNQYGYVFVGIGENANPGRYIVYRIECGRGIRLDWGYEEIEVLEKNFPEIKIGKKMTFVASKRRVKESRMIQGAYARGDPWADHTDGKYILPLDNIAIPDDITDEFGKKRVYLNGQTRHGGVDLKAVNRTSVKAVNSGVVLIVARNFSLEGNMVILDHGSGIFSLYLHLSKINIKQGDRVTTGKIMGLSGATGSVTGPHLHFMIKINFVNVDPLGFIDTMNQHIN